MKAFLTFRYQRVFCPLRRACVELNDMSHLSRSLAEIEAEENKNRPWSEEVMNLEVMEYVSMVELDYQFLG